MINPSIRHHAAAMTQDAWFCLSTLFVPTFAGLKSVGGDRVGVMGVVVLKGGVIIGAGSFDVQTTP